MRLALSSPYLLMENFALLRFPSLPIQAACQYEYVYPRLSDSVRLTPILALLLLLRLFVSAFFFLPLDSAFSIKSVSYSFAAFRAARLPPLLLSAKNFACVTPSRRTLT